MTTDVEFAPQTGEITHPVCSGPHRFGRYVASPATRAVLMDGRPICIGARAFDLLILLLESRGRIVGKDEIFQRVWPTTTVDESNLRFQMTSLRKALGAGRDYIKTIPGRGYLFTVEPGAGAGSAAEDASATQITAVDGQSPVRDALRALVHALRINPDAAATLETLLAA